jgi:hypothetical protein
MEGFWWRSTTQPSRAHQRGQLIRSENVSHVSSMRLQKRARTQKYLAKWDIKDGFWRMDCREGKEWNFLYVLPQPEGTPIMIIVPTSLQMGWVESPPYFCAATETARDIATEYTDMPVGSIPEHKISKYTVNGESYSNLPKEHDGRTFLSMINLCG